MGGGCRLHKSPLFRCSLENMASEKRWQREGEAKSNVKKAAAKKAIPSFRCTF